MESNSRKNKNETTTVFPPISPSNLAETNINKVLVITKNDLDRIHGHLNRHQREEEATMEEIRQKKELHEKSLALTRNWNNTIRGSRRHKLEQKKIKEEKLEKERQIVDLEHAKTMAEERRKALEHAKLLQYHETDKVKSFHSALKLSEVLKEREAQIEMKKMIDEMKKEEEEELKIQSEKILLEKDKNDKINGLKKQAELDKINEFRLKQIEEHKEIAKRNKNATVKEGEMIDQLNEQYQFEKDQLEQIRRKKVKELKENYDQSLDNKRKNKEADQIMDEEENEEIRIYAAAKKKMAILKRQREDEIRKEKDENKEKMISYLGSLMKQAAGDEDFRIAKAIAKQEAKLYQEELFKNLKYEKEINQIAQFRRETIKRKEIEKQEIIREDAEYMKKKMQTDLLYQMYEIDKNKKMQQKLDDISKKNRKLVKEKKDLEKKEIQENRDFIAKEMELMKLEDRQFEDYATKVINYMSKHGRNTYPMKKVLYDQILKTVPSDQSYTEAAKIKNHQNDIPSIKNLGFM